MRIVLAIPAGWKSTAHTRDERDLVEVEGGLQIELDHPRALSDRAAWAEAVLARDPIAGATVEGAGYVDHHTDHGVPFQLASLRLRDATGAIVEGRLVAFYVLGDHGAAVTCRVHGRESLATFGPALEALFRSARFDPQTAPPRIDDVYS